MPARKRRCRPFSVDTGDWRRGAPDQFQYDSLYRLTYASGLYGALAYGCDAVGNRTSQSGGTTNLAETYTYAANSNQLLSVVNSGTTRSLAYSPTGNLASDDHGNGTALSFTYDLSDRMVQVANQNQPLASYAYNFLGQRVAKTTSSTITHFLYDRAGHLVAESNGATGAAQTEYVWLDRMPLALVTNGALYFIHADHLNTPQKATDGARNVAWDTVQRPFGQTEQQTFPSLTNLRFPGQYFDSESGLAQNGFRDYDPSTGRYIESDPIGLKGGVNVYTYVRGNPVGLIDPRGLASGPSCPNECAQNQRALMLAREMLLGLAPDRADPNYDELAPEYNRDVRQFNEEVDLHNRLCPLNIVFPLRTI